MTHQYITDNKERSKSRSRRKKTVMVKAAELVSSCGGQVMVWYKDEYGHVAVFCSSDELYKQYCTDGVKRTTVDNRITLDELEPNYPTPTKTPCWLVCPGFGGCGLVFAAQVLGIPLPAAQVLGVPLPAAQVLGVPVLGVPLLAARLLGVPVLASQVLGVPVVAAWLPTLVLAA